LQIGPFCCELPSLRWEILACEICTSTLALAPLAFVSYAVSDWMWDVILLLRLQEVFGGLCGGGAFLVGEQELHVIMDV
jgi:hypothetical protein